jgi:ankyrin repeat protein
VWRVRKNANLVGPLVGSPPPHSGRNTEEIRKKYGIIAEDIRVLVMRGADVALYDAPGLTVLHYAAYSGKIDVVRVIMEQSWGNRGAMCVCGLLKRCVFPSCDTREECRFRTPRRVYRV